MAIVEFADIDKQIWIEALQTISCRSVQNFTSTEVAEILKVSHKKFVDFEHEPDECDFCQTHNLPDNDPDRIEDFSDADSGSQK